MKTVGVQLPGFDKPVCNSFEPVVRDDQLCYEIDLEKHKDEINIKNQLEQGLIFLMDYNEDIQVFFKDGPPSNENHARMFIETTNNSKMCQNCNWIFFFLF